MLGCHGQVKDLPEHTVPINPRRTIQPVDNQPADRVQPNRLIALIVGRLAIGVFGGVAWNVFASDASGARTIIIRDVIAGLWFALVWSMVYAAAPRLKSLSLARQMIVGALTPFLAMALSVVGLWILPFAIVEYWGLFVLLGVLATGIEWCAGGGRRKPVKQNDKEEKLRQPPPSHSL